VALQVDAGQAIDIPEQWDIEGHHIAEVRRILTEAGHAVSLSARVRRCALIPGGEVVAVVARVDDARGGAP